MLQDRKKTGSLPQNFGLQLAEVLVSTGDLGDLSKKPFLSPSSPTSVIDGQSGPTQDGRACWPLSTPMVNSVQPSIQYPLPCWSTD